MSKFKLYKLSIIALSTYLPYSYATSSEYENEETLQITGSRMSTNAQGNFAQLNRQQIELINPSSTLDLLRRIPFLSITESATGSVSYVSIRAGEPNFTLIMIDGVIVNDTTNSRGGGFDFAQINHAAIEKIEVYRGGISAIYGGDAISGVINIITRKNAQSEISLALGQQHQRNISATFSNSITDKLSLLTSVSLNKRKKSEQALNDNKQALFKISYDKATHQHQAIVSYNETEAKGFAEDSGGELYASPFQAEQRDSKQWLLGLRSFFSINDTLELHVKASWFEHEETSQHPGIQDGVLNGIPASNIVSVLQREQAESFVNYILNDSTNIIGGLSYSDAKGTNEGSLDFGFPLPVDFELNQEVYSAFSEIQHTQNQLVLSAGWRYDNANQFSSENSLRLSSTYALNETTSMFVVYNEGYKLPSFFALAHPLVGNPNLQPERSKNKEVGLSYNELNTTLTLTAFENKFSDLVDFDAELFTNVNRNSVSVTGLELGVNTPIATWLNAGFNVSYTDTEADVSLRRRPNWFGSVNLQASWNAFDILLTIDSRSNYTDSSVATGQVNLGGYAKAGLAVNWQYSNNIQYHLKLDNMLARTYQDSVGFEFNERIIRAGVRYQF